MQKLKLKLLELGKTRSSNASPDMFNFYVVLAGRDQQSYHVQVKTQSPFITEKVQNQKDLPKTWVLTRKQIEDFRRKKNRNIVLDLSKNPSKKTGP